MKSKLPPSKSLTLRVALAQINTKVGDFSGNLAKIKRCIKQGALQGTELLVFPELVISSYPPLDLLEAASFRDANSQAFESLLAWLKQEKIGMKIILGTMIANETAAGRPVFNAAVGIQGGVIQHVQRKQLLPTYNVFDEARYFEAGPRLNAEQSQWSSAQGGKKDFKIGFSVCEDAWFQDLHEGRVIYSSQGDPARALKGADLCVNTSASPFELFKQERRRDLLRAFVRVTSSPLIYVNAVGVNDELAFDGDSCIFDAQGGVLLRLPSFEEVLAITSFDFRDGRLSETEIWKMEDSGKKFLQASHLAEHEKLSETDEKGQGPSQKPKQTPRAGKAVGHPSSTPAQSGFASPLVGVNVLRENDLCLLHDALVLGIRDYFSKSGLSRAVLGLSGGIDSAVVAVLAARALGPGNVTGVSLPSKFSSSHSIEDAQLLASNLGIAHESIPIKMIYTTSVMELKRFSGEPAAVTLAQENLQARLRALMLMALSNQNGSLVLTTGNKSELAVGYCTIYGDMCGALAPLGDVYKSWVYELAHYINKDEQVIPRSTLTKAPSAELRENQTDQDSLPPYELLDPVLQAHLEWRQSAGQIRETLLPYLKKMWDAGEVSAITGEGNLTKVLRLGQDWLGRSDFLETILRLIAHSEFKRRQAAPVLKVTPRAFGLGRRIPVVKQG